MELRAFPASKKTKIVLAPNIAVHNRFRLVSRRYLGTISPLGGLAQLVRALA